jgi:hypothetical protein
MFFQVNETAKINGLGGLAGPGSHYYPIVEVAAPCHLFHLYMATFEPETCDHINRHFISTQIAPILRLIKGDQVESVSIFIQRTIDKKRIEGCPELDIVQEIFKLQADSDSSYIYILDNDKEVFDYFNNVTGETVQKTLVYRHSDSSFFASSEAKNE